MLMKRHCSGDKLCSKSKLFLIRALCMSVDSSECEIISAGSDTRQGKLVKFTEEQTGKSSCFLGWGANFPNTLTNWLVKRSKIK